MPKNSEPTTIKVQATLRGYNAWAFQRLVKRKRESPAEEARIVFNDWIKANTEYLKTLGITPEQYRQETGEGGADVVEIANHGKNAG